MERVSDYIISKLVENGIKHIFLLTGRGILYLTDAVAKNKDIQAISTYHEQGASYAAMAYAAASDGMSACLVSTGCAATNAVTAALCAYQDNLPIVFISGQNILNETTRYTGVPIRTYGSQEADIIPVVQSITKFSAMLTKADDVACIMEEAIYTANNGRKGPVWIDVPLDIQNARVNKENLEHFIPEEILSKPTLDDIHMVVEMLNSSFRPVVFIGGGVRNAGAVEILSNFVELNKIPVVFSASAADIYGTGNELSIGAVGSLGGSRAGNFTVQNADLILAIGTKLCSQSVGRFEQFGREAKVIVVDVDANEHKKMGVKIDKLIISDAKEFLERLNEETINNNYERWIDKVIHWKKVLSIKNEEYTRLCIDENKIDLYHFADMLSEHITTDATVITDAGLEELIIPSTIRYKGNQRCLFPAAQGAMGYAIPAIIGAHYAGRNNIICVVGDGSVMMNIQELQIISSNRIPAKIFVINNNMYSVIRKRQHDLFRSRTIGNDPSDGVPAPKFEKISVAFGIGYERIANEQELSDNLRKILSMDGPQICEVMCVENQQYFHMSYAINEKRKMVKRPIEDLSPFLSRELINSEMIIKPIEE